eukprot:12329120-Alexandrium_andersonii.AAC.1
MPSKRESNASGALPWAKPGASTGVRGGAAGAAKSGGGGEEGSGQSRRLPSSRVSRASKSAQCSTHSRLIAG